MIHRRPAVSARRFSQAFQFAILLLKIPGPLASEISMPENLALKFGFPFVESPIPHAVLRTQVFGPNRGLMFFQNATDLCVCKWAFHQCLQAKFDENTNVQMDQDSGRTAQGRCQRHGCADGSLA